MHPDGPARLERSCTASPRDWIKTASPQPGFERLEAFFAGHGFDPHRHDTYAIGLTLHGVQSFGYRGTTVHSTPGQAIVLHPDEVHDGRAGTEAGFRYRMAYIEPRLIQAALGARMPLPFVGEAVVDDALLISSITPTLLDLDMQLEDLHLDQIILAVAEALVALDRSSSRKEIRNVSVRAVTHVREFLDANSGQMVSSNQVEAIGGLNRFALARHFRTCLGTSPYRYLVMRRLDHARHLILSGSSIAEAAASSGFADQSHMTRQFKRAYGLSPGRWRDLIALRKPRLH